MADTPKQVDLRDGHVFFALRNGEQLETCPREAVLERVASGEARGWIYEVHEPVKLWVGVVGFSGVLSAEESHQLELRALSLVDPSFGDEVYFAGLLSPEAARAILAAEAGAPEDV